MRYLTQPLAIIRCYMASGAEEYIPPKLRMNATPIVPFRIWANTVSGNGIPGIRYGIYERWSWL